MKEQLVKEREKKKNYNEREKRWKKILKDGRGEFKKVENMIFFITKRKEGWKEILKDRREVEQ